MWVFTPQGFFSAVQHRDDKTKVMVRCRCEMHARRLSDKITSMKYPRPPVVHTPPPADYEWRLTISKMEWTAFLRRSTVEMDYPNFKNAAAKVEHPPGFLPALHDVWDDLYRVQHPRPKLSLHRDAAPLQGFDVDSYTHLQEEEDAFCFLPGDVVALPGDLATKGTVRYAVSQEDGEDDIVCVDWWDGDHEQYKLSAELELIEEVV